MKSTLCLSMIKSKYQTFTVAEKKAADFVLTNREKVISMSVAEFSQAANMAKSAVIRFCKSAGFEGFSDFKIALAMELSKNKKLNYTPYIYPDDTVSDIFDKVFSANVKTLHDTAENINRSILKEVVETLFNAKSIYIYGIGTSRALAEDFQYRLSLLGKCAFCYSDVVSMKISSMNITKGDVAIGVSHSGRTIATVEALRAAKDKDALTISITSTHQSPITQESTFPIEVCTDEVEYPIEAISARIAHLSVIDAITTALSAKNYDDTLQRSILSSKMIDTIRYER